MNAARGLVKPFGIRIPKCTTRTFEDRAFETLPDELRARLVPLLESIGDLCTSIAEYDKKLEGLAEGIEAVRRMRTIPGVGALTASSDRSRTPPALSKTLGSAKARKGKVFLRSSDEAESADLVRLNEGFRSGRDSDSSVC